MTVSELIAELQKYDPDYVVVLNHHEGYWHEDVTSVEVTFRYLGPSYSGTHMEANGVLIT